MVSVVVLVVALLAPAFGLPFTTPEHTPGFQIEQGTSAISNVPQTQTEVQEKTGVPASTGCSAGYPGTLNQDVVQPVTRVQDAPVNVEQAQVPHTETLFLPPQPVPVTQVDQIVRPVVVPAEAIASGRVIIMAVEPIQQRAFPDVILVPQQQPIASETPIQPVQTLEKQTPYQENYAPVQQIVQSNVNEEPQKQTQVKFGSTQQQAYPEQPAVQKQAGQSVVQVQPTQQQTVQQVEHVEKQAQSGADYTPVTHTGEPSQRLQTAETVQQENFVQQAEKVQKVESEPQQQVYTSQAVPENVQKQVECATAQTQPQQRVNVQEVGEQAQQSETYQQQPYSVKPEQVVQQIQSVEPQQEVQQQVSQVQVTKTGNQQVHEAPQQVSTFATEQVYNFGDKIPQQHPVNQQQYLVQPVVVENQ